MPRSVLAAVMPAPNVPVEIREFPEPDLPPGGALLRTAFSEVCGTDVHLWHGRLSGVPYPIIPGHVTTGTLDAARGPMRDVLGRALTEGDRLAFFDVHRTCGRCLACTVHRTPTRCPSRRVYGITDPASEGLLGGWAQKVYLEPGVIVAKLPDAVTFEAYIGGGCGLLTSVHIIDRARLTMGDTVVVQVSGAVRVSATALAKRARAGPVIVIGAPDLLTHVMGADAVIDLDATSSTRSRDGSHGRHRRRRRINRRITRVRRRSDLRATAAACVATTPTSGDSTINVHETSTASTSTFVDAGAEAALSARDRSARGYGAEVPWHRIGADVRESAAPSTMRALRIPRRS